LALNGYTYDDVVVKNGNNILDIIVYAELVDSTPAGPPPEQCQLGSRSCSEAIIGHRTLIAEPTNASIHEAVHPADPGGT
jgi:hypothetical protein